MILAIESSCDESSVSVFDPMHGVINSTISSQIDLHSIYGGVVPDLAAREHVRNFPYIIEELQLSKYINELSKVCVTCGPGLAGCLAIGGMHAKAIGNYFNLKVYGVNHLKGHAWSPFINLHKSNPNSFKENIKKYMPHIGLIISGGNTILFEINNYEFKILAQTVDDAAGEALDKGGKLLGIDYPAGPKIETLSLNGDNKNIISRKL